MADLITIGEVARRSGVAASALRFYEERGLITSDRAGSGHRRYPRPVLRRIAFIVFAQRVGLTLDEIGAELAKLPPRGDASGSTATGARGRTAARTPRRPCSRPTPSTARPRSASRREAATRSASTGGRRPRPSATSRSGWGCRWWPATAGRADGGGPWGGT